MTRTITHVEINYADGACWSPLNFVTRDEAGKYYYRFEENEVALADIQKRVDAAEMCALASPVSIRQGQEAYRGPDQHIYIACSEKPASDTHSIRVADNPSPFRDWNDAFHQRSRTDRYTLGSLARR